MKQEQQQQENFMNTSLKRSADTRKLIFNNRVVKKLKVSGAERLLTRLNETINRSIRSRMWQNLEQEQ